MTLKGFFEKYWFGISTIILFILSLILRFYNYPNRWGLALDQAHDVLIARYSLESWQIPLVGPFSSAGPMQTGGQWYWFIMAGVILDKSLVISPWVFLTLIYGLFVILIVLLGREIINKKFGILLGVMATVSTAQIAQGVNLTNQSPMALISLLAIWSMIRFLKSRKNIFLFTLGLSVSTAISFHFQGVALISFVAITLIIARVGLKGIMATSLGLFIPFIPMLIFDLKNDFVNSRNILHYYLYDQYKISLDVLGRRWKTYAGEFWPNAWSHVIGGNIILGYFLIASSVIFSFYSFIKKQVPKEWLIIIISFGTMISIIRYVRTPIYDSYIVFLHPFIFLITGWVIYFLYSKNKILSCTFLVAIILFSLVKDNAELNYNKSNVQPKEAEEEITVLKRKFPNDKFSVYAYKHQVSDRNFILALYLHADNLISDDGRGISLVNSSNYTSSKYTTIYTSVFGDKLIDLGSSKESDIEKEDFANVNPKKIFERTEEWYTN